MRFSTLVNNEAEEPTASSSKHSNYDAAGALGQFDFEADEGNREERSDSIDSGFSCASLSSCDDEEDSSTIGEDAPTLTAGADLRRFSLGDALIGGGLRAKADWPSAAEPTKTSASAKLARKISASAQNLPMASALAKRFSIFERRPDQLQQQQTPPSASEVALGGGGGVDYPAWVRSVKRLVQLTKELKSTTTAISGGESPPVGDESPPGKENAALLDEYLVRRQIDETVSVVFLVGETKDSLPISQKLEEG